MALPGLGSLGLSYSSTKVTPITGGDATFRGGDVSNRGVNFGPQLDEIAPTAAIIVGGLLVAYFIFKRA